MSGPEVSLEAIAGELAGAGSVLVMTHRNPDGDAVGCCVAAGLLLKRMGVRTAYAVQEERMGLAGLFGEGEFFSMPLEDSYGAALVLDCSTRENVGRAVELSRCAKILQIDHHRSGVFGYAGFVDSSAAACGELVHDLYAVCGLQLCEQSAAALYLALSSDTGGFAYSSTSAKTHLIAADLHRFTSRQAELSAYAGSLTPAMARVIAASLGSCRFSREGRFVFCEVRVSDDYSPGDDTGVLTELLRSLRGCEVLALLKETGPDSFKVSLRANTDRIDLSVIAVNFGGGGHAAAAGFDWNGPADALEEILLKETAGLWMAP